MLFYTPIHIEQLSWWIVILDIVIYTFENLHHIIKRIFCYLNNISIQINIWGWKSNWLFLLSNYFWFKAFITTIYLSPFKTLSIYLIAMRKGNFLAIILMVLLLAGFSQAQFGVCDPPCRSCKSGSSTMCETCIFSYQISGDYCVPTECQVLYCQNCM